MLFKINSEVFDNSKINATISLECSCNTLWKILMRSPMIVGYDNVSGSDLEKIFNFVHSSENLVSVAVSNSEKPQVEMIARFRAITPQYSQGNASYKISMTFLEWVPQLVGPGKIRIDSKYSKRIYDIIGEPISDHK